MTEQEAKMLAAELEHNKVWRVNMITTDDAAWRFTGTRDPDHNFCLHLQLRSDLRAAVLLYVPEAAFHLQPAEDYLQKWPPFCFTIIAPGIEAWKDSVLPGTPNMPTP